MLRTRLRAPGGGLGFPAVIPGRLSSRFTTTRAQTNSGLSTSLAADDITTLTYAANQPRYHKAARGLLMEATRTNLFLNSAVGGAQGVTVAATAHSLSFRGTGTITLTGTSTAGPLVGSGANSRVELNFTPTAGTLTLTVSGDVREVQLEAAAFASSPILTGGSSSQRNLDTANGVASAFGIPDNGASTIFMLLQMGVFRATNRGLLHVGDGTSANRFCLRIATGAGAITLVRALASVTASATVGTYTASVPFLVAMTVLGDGNAWATFNGGASVTVAGGPTSGINSLRLGTVGGGNEPLIGEILQTRVFPYGMTTSLMESLATKLLAAWT